MVIKVPPEEPTQEDSVARVGSVSEQSARPEVHDMEAREQVVSFKNSLIMTVVGCKFPAFHLCLFFFLSP